jgi:hypothetical protein
MQDILSMVGSLRRPSLLVQAARFGVDAYDRASSLPRLMCSLAIPRPGEAIMRLIEIEADCNSRRVEATADYSAARHVEVLIALLGEARLMRATQRPALAGPT